MLDKHIFRDVGSGTNLERDGLSALRRAVQQREVDAIWIHDTDRIARNAVDFMTIFREFLDHDVSLKSVRKAVNTGPYGDLIAFIDAWVDEQEHKSILRRSKDGKNHSARGGLLRIGDLRGIYGYDYVPETKGRVINQNEAEIVREIFARVTAGDSSNSIARDLQRRGVPTKRGGLWDFSTIKAIVNRTSYYGLDLYCRTRRQVVNGKVKRVKLPEQDWIRAYDYSPAIITQQEYEAAHQSLQAKNRRRPRKGHHPLNGYVTCGACGGKVSGRSSIYYRCVRSVAKRNSPKRCDAGHIRKDALEMWVWATVCATIRDPQTIFPILFPRMMGDPEQIEAKLAATHRAIEQNERHHHQLLDLWQSDTIEDAVLHAGLADLRAEWEQLQQDVEELENQRSKSLDLAARAAQFTRACREVADRVDRFNPEELPAILSTFGVRITATREKATCTISVDPDTVAGTLSPVVR